MKKFEALNDQEKKKDFGSENKENAKKKVSVKPITLIIVAVCAVVVIIVLCVVLFGDHKNPTSISPANNSAVEQTEKPMNNTIPSVESNSELNPVTDLRTVEKVCPEVVSYEYCVSNGYLHFYVKLYNPSETTIIKLPSIRVTARDANGAILGSDEYVYHVIYPKQEVNYSDQAFAVDETPASLTIEPIEPEQFKLISLNSANHKDYMPLISSGVAIRSDKVVGEIENSNNFDIGMIRVSVIYRNSNGEMIGSDMDFPDGLTANNNIPFSVNFHGNNSSDISSVDVFAEPWGFDFEP